MRFWMMLATSFALLAATAPAAAQDRLAPSRAPEANDPTAGYDSDIRLVFDEALAPGVQARVIIRPSFSPEVAVGLRAKGDGYELFALMPEQMIWSYSLVRLMENGHLHVTSADLNGDSYADATKDEIARLKAAVPARPQDMPLARCTVSLPAAPAQAILQVWRKMLDEIRPDEGPAMGLDGTTYVFSMPSVQGETAGEAWSPRTGSRLGRLVSLAETMRDYCRSGGEGRLRRISALAAKLAAR